MPLTPLPSGAAHDVVAKCDELPNKGHIRVYDLAWILGISHGPLARLPRSMDGWVTLETALKEVERREPKVRTTIHESDSETGQALLNNLYEDGDEGEGAA